MTADLERSRRRDVPVAQYRYRHEAEFAAGFLEDARIPFRLQMDDAGGADIAATFGRPAVIWVRAEDAPAAMDLLSHMDEDEDLAIPGMPEADAAAVGIFGPTPSAETRTSPRLRGAERGIAGMASVVFGALTASFRGSASGVWIVGLVLGLVLSVMLAAAAITGRAPGWLRALLRRLSGGAP